MDQAREEYELGMRCLANGEAKRAQKHIRKAIQLSPDNAAYHWGLGSVYLDRGEPDYPAAIEEFRKVINLRPEWSEGYLNLANALHAKGDFEASMPHYKKTMELVPDDPRPIVALGVCLTKLERYDEAVAMLRRGLSLNPHYGKASAHLFVAEALLANGAVEQACKEWEVVLALKPMYPEFESAAQRAREMLSKYRR